MAQIAGICPRDPSKMMMKYACSTWNSGWVTRVIDVDACFRATDLCPPSRLCAEWLRDKGYDPGRAAQFRRRGHEQPENLTPRSARDRDLPAPVAGRSRVWISQAIRMARFAHGLKRILHETGDPMPILGQAGPARRQDWRALRPAGDGGRDDHAEAAPPG